MRAGEKIAGYRGANEKAQRSLPKINRIMAATTANCLTDNRKYLATMAADYLTEMQSKLLPEYPHLLKIHWDDCDMDERRFWFHFRRPGLVNVKETGTPVVKDCAKMIKKLKEEALKLMEPSMYECHWSPHSKPVMRYRQYDHRRTPDGYDTDTWIYVLSFYG